ncbi:MAG TPA: DUF374 domain-containing protein [Candidatus Acidoferrales bacterium]|nr:DUF374 domain-containing protein [Candidatus Acidoferrales bacterium]
MRSLRPREVDRAAIAELLAPPRLVIATYHGMLFNLLACAGLVCLPPPRQFFVMTSPSYDGRLLAAFLRRFGIGSVRASSRSRSVSGSAEFIRRIEAGDIGLIAVDGPRGPRGAVKPGFLKLAAVAGAEVILLAAGASYGITFPTWDRAQLPGPFARIDLAFERFPVPSRGPGFGDELQKLQTALEGLALQVGSAIVRESRARPSCG